MIARICFIKGEDKGSKVSKKKLHERKNGKRKTKKQMLDLIKGNIGDQVKWKLRTWKAVCYFIGREDETEEKEV